VLLAPLYRLYLGDVVGSSSLGVILPQHCAQFNLAFIFFISFTLLSLSIVLEDLPDNLFWGLEIYTAVLIAHLSVFITAPDVTVAFAVISNTILSRCLDPSDGDISAQSIFEDNLSRVVLLNHHDICAELTT
jgi:hypothetical protein